MNATPPSVIKMSLSDAQWIGAMILDALSPFCTRIVLAGSVRRHRPVCGDLDIVCELKEGEINALQDRLAKRTRVVSGNGVAGKNLIRLLNVPKFGGDIQIDLFIARTTTHDLAGTVPGNWGSILLCRTGSPSHNIRICARAEDQGLKWNPYRGITDKDGNVLASETEEDIYKLLGIPFHEPQQRDAVSF